MGKSLKTIAAIAVAVFAPYAAAALGLTGFAATAFSFVLSSAVSSLLGGDEGGGGSNVRDSGFLVNKTSNVAGIPIIYGARRIGGTRVYLQTTDVNGATSGTQYLHVVLAFAQGGTRSDGTDAIDTVSAIQLNGTEAWTSAGGFQGVYNSSNLTVRIWHGKNDQTVASPDQSAGSFALSDEWTSNHRMRGVAYAYLIMKYDRDVFPGAPTITLDVSGKRIQAVNSLGSFVNTSAEVTNPANIIYDYLTNERYGKGLIDTDGGQDIDRTSFENARTWANTAGVDFNGAVNTGDSILANIQKMLSCANMNLVYTNGKYSLQPIKQESFTGAFEFTTANIIGKWTISLGNKKNRFNKLKVNFFNPDLDWQPDSVIIDDNSNSPATTYLTDDSDVVNEKSVDLPLIGDKTLAEKIGTYYLNVSRYQKLVSFKASHEALKLAVGDPVTVTHDVPGWTNEQFRVNSVTLFADSTVDVVLEEYAPDSTYLENN